MKWQSMKTAPSDGRIVWVTIRDSDGAVSVYPDWYPFRRTAIAWTGDPNKPTPYTGTVEELDAEVHRG
jgi:hypothetical protein